MQRNLLSILFQVAYIHFTAVGDLTNANRQLNKFKLQDQTMHFVNKRFFWYKGSIDSSLQIQSSASQKFMVGTEMGERLQN